MIHMYVLPNRIGEWSLPSATSNHDSHSSHQLSLDKGASIAVQEIPCWSASQSRCRYQWLQNLWTTHTVHSRNKSTRDNWLVIVQSDQPTDWLVFRFLFCAAASFDSTTQLELCGRKSPTKSTANIWLWWSGWESDTRAWEGIFLSFAWKLKILDSHKTGQIWLYADFYCYKYHRNNCESWENRKTIPLYR